MIHLSLLHSLKKLFVVFSQWNEWTPCSKSCGTGENIRERKCEQGSCNGPVIQSKDCNVHDCPSK